MAIECYIVTLNTTRIPDTFRREANDLHPKRMRRVVKCDHLGMAMLDAREEFIPTSKPNEDIEEISSLEGDTERTIKVGRALPQEIKASPVELLKKTPRCICFLCRRDARYRLSQISHHLSINPNMKLVKLKKRTQGKNRGS